MADQKQENHEKEREISNAIRIALSDIADLMRNNVGVATHNGIRVAYGLGVGSSDLVGIRRRDGRFVALEVKQAHGRPTLDQLRFIKRIRQSGGIAGVVRSVDEALRLVNGDEK
jgi:hypothetical protein